MATWLYRKEFPKGKLFDDKADLKELANDGWVDNPSKIEEEKEEILDRKALLEKAKELELEFNKNIKTVDLKNLIDTELSNRGE